MVHGVLAVRLLLVAYHGNVLLVEVTVYHLWDVEVWLRAVFADWII